MSLVFGVLFHTVHVPRNVPILQHIPKPWKYTVKKPDRWVPDQLCSNYFHQQKELQATQIYSAMCCYFSYWVKNLSLVPGIMLTLCFLI